MKKLSVTPITNSAQFFPKKGTLEFLQLTHRETTAATIIALIGSAYSASVVYVLYGCVNSGTYPVYTITAGAVFYNGEIYYVDAASFTASGANVAVFSTVQTQYTTDADPCTFSDATTHNIHNIVKMQITAGAVGSTIADLSQGFYMSFTIPQQLILTGSGVAAVTGSYPNLNIYVPTPPTSTNPILFAGSFNVGDPGASSYTVTFGVTLSTASYYVVGTIICNGTPSVDVRTQFGINNRTTTSFGLHLNEWTAGFQNIAIEYIIFAK